jgi:hypothetical protein
MTEPNAGMLRVPPIVAQLSFCDRQDDVACLAEGGRTSSAYPLYFLPGDENATVQLTVFNFQSQFNTQYNLLFADILLITIPPLLLYLFLNRRIVEGLTAGAVKG